MLIYFRSSDRTTVSEGKELRDSRGKSQDKTEKEKEKKKKSKQAHQSLNFGASRPTSTQPPTSNKNIQRRNTTGKAKLLSSLIHSKLLLQWWLSILFIRIQKKTPKRREKRSRNQHLLQLLPYYQECPVSSPKVSLT